MIEIKVDTAAMTQALDRLAKSAADTSPVMRAIAGVMHDAVMEDFDKGGRRDASFHRLRPQMHLRCKRLEPVAVRGSLPSAADCRCSPQAMDKFIHVRSDKFPILPGEEAELVNPGMYGKALAQYLQGRLASMGYDAPFICCEDWGWWVELKDAPFTFGVCIYCGPEREGLLDLFCTPGATSRKVWSWRMFRSIDTTPWVERLHADLVAIFEGDPAIELVGTALESPFPDDQATDERE